MINKRIDNSGFTLIELMIALAISGIVMGGVLFTYTSQQKTYLAQDQIVDMQQNIRAVMYIMTKELRMAGYDPHVTYNPGIVAAGDGSNGNPLTFTLVADEDGIDNDSDLATDEEGEFMTISYQLIDANGNGNVDLGRDDGISGLIPIAENISSLVFTYLDEDGVATAVLDDIRTIQVTITAMPDPGKIDHAKTTRTLSSRIRCRNLGL